MTNAYQLHKIEVSVAQKSILNMDKLTIPAEKCTVLIGDNGAGKSTLLRVLAFLQPLNQGDIKLFGKTIKWPIPVQLRKRIGFVDQHPFLLSGSVADNIKLALTLQKIPFSQHTQLIEQALEQTQTSHLAGQDVKTLSGGELKRVAIARSIVYHPDILLLDEPFSHLDYQQISFLEDFIYQFTRQTGKTVILSTHDRLQGMALSDNTINLVAGKISPSPLINIFSGQLETRQFHTRKITINTTSTQTEAHHLAVDPEQIIISRQPLTSSMQNTFKGRLFQIIEQANTVILAIDCGEIFYAMISTDASHKLDLRIGQDVFLSFKSSAVTLF